MATDSFPFPTSTTDSGAIAEGGLAGGVPLRAAATLPAGNPAAPFGDSRGDLVDRVARTAHATIDRLADTAGPYVNRLSDSLDSAGGRVQDGAGQVREVGNEWADSLRLTVREHPLAAVGAALAIGLLMARLSR